MIVEITEPGSGSKLQHDDLVAVGIDFGTTNSVIFYCDGSGEQFEFSIESIINVLDTSDIVVGKNLSEAALSIRSIKRLFGKSTSEITGMHEQFVHAITKFLDLKSAVPSLRVLDKFYTLPLITSAIFKALVNEAEKKLGFKVKHAVVTVPAYFNYNARGQVITAAKLAGLEVLRLIAEPTAAAYAYGLNQSKVGTYLVYDFGGGTFDVSILNMSDGVFQVIATAGDNFLGGDDLDLLLAQKLSHTSHEPVDLVYARKIKEHLSEHDVFEDQNLHITRQELDNLILPIIQKTISIACSAHQQVDYITLDGVILVGGSSRIPLVHKMLKEHFATKLIDTIDPESSVAIGAALQAMNLTSSTTHKKGLIIDAIPLSLGIELYGGLVEKIILRNSPIPLSVTKEFTTYADNQTAIKFHILQGERELVKDCRSLVQFELQDIPPMPAGKAKIDVTFSIDADGILSVSALEKVTQKFHTVELNPTFGLHDSVVLQILEESYQNAKQDHECKLLQDAITNANVLISHLERAIKETPNILPIEEIDLIKTQISKLLFLTHSSEDRTLIINGIEDLKNESAKFVSTRINAAIAKKLKGRHVNEVSNQEEIEPFSIIPSL